jgi:hypothetical protein
MVVGAVLSELVSGNFYPENRERTGKTSRFGPLKTKNAPVSHTISNVYRRIPCNTEQGTEFAGTGKLQAGFREFSRGIRQPGSRPD